MVLLKYGRPSLQKTLSAWGHVQLYNLYIPFSNGGANSIGTNAPLYSQRCRTYK